MRLKLFVLEIAGDVDDATRILNVHYPDVVPLLMQVIPHPYEFSPAPTTVFLYRALDEIKPTKLAP